MFGKTKVQDLWFAGEALVEHFLKSTKCTILKCMIMHGNRFRINESLLIAFIHIAFPQYLVVSSMLSTLDKLGHQRKENAIMLAASQGMFYDLADPQLHNQLCTLVPADIVASLRCKTGPLV
jgi:hypothetical protein